MQILQKTEVEGKRSSKLSLDDFLKLLYIFNENGIHFRWYYVYFIYNIWVLVLAKNQESLQDKGNIYKIIMQINLFNYHKIYPNFAC